MGILDRGKSQGDRDPFIGDGRHKLAIERYFAFKHDTHGFSIGCTFFVLESGVHPVGTSVFKAWNIKRGPKFKGDKCDGELNEATKFLARLVGGTDDDAHQVANDALDGEDMYDGPNHRRNPLRGMVITAVGVTKDTKTIDPATNLPKKWTDVNWIHDPQAEDPAQIAALRAHLDAVKPVQVQATRAAAPVAPQPQYAPQPQVQYGAPQYPQAPAAPATYPQQPAYPPQGYAPAPVAAPQGYPPGVPTAAPQYAPQPAYPQAPAAAPTQYPPGVLPPGLIPGTGR